MSERPMSPRVEASRRAQEHKRAKYAQPQEERIQKKELPPSFLQRVGYLFGKGKMSVEVELPRVFPGNAENYASRLASAKAAARLTMLDENPTYKEEYPIEYHRFAIGAYLEDALREGHLPSVIISEDVSGRLMSETMRVFLTKVQRRMGTTSENVPVIAYPVGRTTPVELRAGYAQDIRKKLDTSHKGASVLVVTDIIENGTTIQPLLEAVVGAGFSIGVLVTRLNVAQKQLMNALHAPSDLKFLTSFAPINRGMDSDMRPVLRNDTPTAEVPNALFATELEEDRGRRLQTIEEVAEVMYQTFLERPGVKAFLEEQDTAAS